VATDDEQLRADAEGHEDGDGGADDGFRGDVEIRGDRTRSADRRPQDVLGVGAVGEIRDRNEA
jgi:hypothetical protein